ncbi:MAG: helix-turn-helix domain-containing protein [Desulfosporosinus sp.]|nr:helix-turn-helix domain-containing protein [Desulfosporosinus sp.]
MASRNIIDTQKLGDAIAKKREKLRLTQEELGTQASLSRSYIADLEAGRYTPSLNALCQIAKALKTDLNFLLRMTEIQDIKEG